ncbi:MAG: hypothetical protein R3250_09200, partial [Melioribacteraceae bacterium]|nr:hypothetical protein [Melioribacteraceae bacterium]
NVAVNQSISYEDAFQAYINALNGTGAKYMKLKLLGRISSIVESKPLILNILHSLGEKRFVFNVWRPGFDMTYSSQKLLSTSYHFRWINFEEVILSCIKDGINN